MAAGIALRNATRTAIDQLGNTVIVTNRTSASGVMDDIIWTDTTSASITAATTNNVISKYIKMIAGDIETGDLIIYVKDTNTVLKSDKLTFNTIDYTINPLKPIYVENVLVVNVATCYKEHN